MAAVQAAEQGGKNSKGGAEAGGVGAGWRRSNDAEKEANSRMKRVRIKMSMGGSKPNGTVYPSINFKKCFLRL